MENLISGILNINKPCGETSFDVVSKVKRILKIKKVGHCGTLDPLACGVLVVVFGKATKLAQSFVLGRKVYRTRVKLGFSTDTGDLDGRVTGTKAVGPVSKKEIEASLARFVGEIEQIPPMYSALKFKGKRLYELARAGISVERKPRKITIYAIELLEFEKDALDIRVECSSGTYIRTLAEDIGRSLGYPAVVEFLCREKVEPFNLEDSLDGKELSVITREQLFSKCLPLEKPV
jgi:tRNA pseudouridine55 synthase